MGHGDALLTGLALDPELLARLDRWLTKQRFPPTKTAVFEEALRTFLDTEEKRRG